MRSLSPGLRPLHSSNLYLDKTGQFGKLMTVVLDGELAVPRPPFRGDPQSATAGLNSSLRIRRIEPARVKRR